MNPKCRGPFCPAITARVHQTSQLNPHIHKQARRQANHPPTATQARVVYLENPPSTCLHSSAHDQTQPYPCMPTFSGPWIAAERASVTYRYKYTTLFSFRWCCRCPRCSSQWCAALAPARLSARQTARQQCRASAACRWCAPPVPPGACRGARTRAPPHPHPHARRRHRDNPEPCPAGDRCLRCCRRWHQKATGVQSTQHGGPRLAGVQAPQKTQGLKGARVRVRRAWMQGPGPGPRGAARRRRDLHLIHHHCARSGCRADATPPRFLCGGGC
mmetsp:Transcript_19300/g.49117  ORF Transcript_19300/g.49117 Transcript_19300/m.49117 type:complete len:273 (-) Transcript_19300:629-1447(-)